MKYPHLAARIFNTPLLIHPQKLDAIIAGLGNRLLGNDAIQFDAPHGELAELFTQRRGERRFDEASAAGYLFHDGVAQVNVLGALAHRTRMDADSTRILGYDQIARDLKQAESDTDVHSIVMLMDSPGGEAAGAFELAELVRDVSAHKPITAVVDSMAASAGYLIASGASEIVTTGSGYAGSIGVVMRHVDFSRALEQDGVAITHIFAGDHKVDGNPFEPLPEAVRADLQADVNELYDMFVAIVSTHRGITAEHVRGTQARMYRGSAAVDAGLVDRVAAADQIISEMQGQRPRVFSVGQPARATVSKGETTMSDTMQPAGDTKQPVTSATTEAHETVSQVGIDAAHAEGYESGRQAEAERVAGILSLVADDNVHTFRAAHEAIKTGMSVDHAKVAIDAVASASRTAVQALPSIATATGNDLGPDIDTTEPDERQAARAAVAQFYGRTQ